MSDKNESGSGSTNEHKSKDESSNSMRRCFMTGKRCIYQRLNDSHGKKDDFAGIFVIMPFRPNLDTFYEWRLKPFLESRYKEKYGNIKRADQVSRTGYVMCEIICRHIQRAKLIVVDLSVPNPNVYYEFGLAVGLKKRLLLLCNNESGRMSHSERKSHIEKWLGSENKINVIPYQGVDSIGDPNRSEGVATTNIELKSLDPKMKILPLIVKDPDKQNDEPSIQKKDITVSFAETIQAAIEIAVDRLKPDSVKGVIDRDDRRLPRDDDPQYRPEPDKQLHDLLKGLDKYNQKLLYGSHEAVEISEMGGKKEIPFDKIAEKVNKSFACVVDLADENEIAYFWLGYCHGRGINVIPVVRTATDNIKTRSDEGGSGANKLAYPSENPLEERPSVLAFDIRALWYISHSDHHPERLAYSLQRILRELILNDVPFRQRTAFWERLIHTGTVHIFTGAFHHPDLNREVVGDWDLRAVSELVSYLSATGESVIPQLEQPVYAPETIFEKIMSGRDKEDTENQQSDKPLPRDFRMIYIDFLKKELKNKNCLIVASAESNPYTEVVLAHAFSGNDTDRADEICFTEPNAEELRSDWTIALKGGSADIIDQKDKKQQISRKRCFSRPGVKLWIQKDQRPIEKSWPQDGHRGFLFQKNLVISKKYMSQDDAEAGKKFSVLAQFLVTYNPFSDEGKNNIIVVLNGVSGPGTYAVAEALTGGKNKKDQKEAEKVLQKVNEKWEKKSIKFQGVEGFLTVSVSPPDQNTGNQGDKNEADGEPSTETQNLIDTCNKREIEDNFRDQRKVEQWKLTEDSNLKKNPRPIGADDS